MGLKNLNNTARTLATILFTGNVTKRSPNSMFVQLQTCVCTCVCACMRVCAYVCKPGRFAFANSGWLRAQVIKHSLKQ